MKTTLVLIAACALSISPVWAKQYRSQAARHEFVRLHACPATERHKLPCKGWIIDHKQGLCVGGADTPQNMAWMTVATAKAKDRWECRPGWEAKLEQCSVNDGELECGK
jgi:hypothetical protein